MSKPLEVGDIVVFNPKYVIAIPGMQQIASILMQVFFGPTDVMVVRSIKEGIKGVDSQSGRIVDVALAIDPDGPLMVEVDSDWFIRKETNENSIGQ